MNNASRREFLRRASALSVLGSAGAPFALNLAAMSAASAQAASGYKALVCVFLFGGNDSYNMVLPTDTTSWNNYQAIRNQAPDPIALMAPGTAPNAGAVAGSPARLGGVLALSPTHAQGRSFALHPLMGGMAGLFNTQKRLAIISNVGPLVMPTTKAQYNTSSYPKPAKLFSHNDQQSTWQALGPEGTRVGWGGLMGDVMMGGNSNAIFTSISVSGNAVWLAGNQVRQYQVGSGGAIRIGGSGTTLFGSSAAFTAMRTIMGTARSSHVLEQDHAAVVARSVSAESLLSANLPAAGLAPHGTPATPYSQNTDPLLQYDNPLTGAKAPNSLAQQLQVVARSIAARSSLGATRQVFFVSMGGFDTHDIQNRSQADLMAKLNHALTYFDAVLTSMGLGDKVTTFTASDFGRTFTSNGDGTDHGWGAHHFVIGGAVNGGDIYGTFPMLGTKNAGNNSFDSSPDQLGNGSLLPAQSVDQYAATLGKWFDLSDAQLLTIFPNLANWNVGQRNLGFMV